MVVVVVVVVVVVAVVIVVVVVPLLQHFISRHRRLRDHRGFRERCLSDGQSVACSDVKNTLIIARNHYSQIYPYEGALSRCEINPTWAIMGHHGLFLTTDYNVWFLDSCMLRWVAACSVARSVQTIVTFSPWMLTGMITFASAGVQWFALDL